MELLFAQRVRRLLLTIDIDRGRNTRIGREIRLNDNLDFPIALLQWIVIFPSMTSTRVEDEERLPAIASNDETLYEWASKKWWFVRDYEEKIKATSTCWRWHRFELGWNIVAGKISDASLDELDREIYYDFILAETQLIMPPKVSSPSFSLTRLQLGAIWFLCNIRWEKSLKWKINFILMSARASAKALLVNQSLIQDAET